MPSAPTGKREAGLPVTIAFTLEHELETSVNDMLPHITDALTQFNAGYPPQECANYFANAEYDAD